jgi:AraC-like DNA-binding protein
VLCLNFFDYVNGLRVAEVQRSLQADASSGQSLLEVAFAAGFNSKSTFNAAFRKLTGSAPSAWRSAQGAASVRADPLRRPAASGSPH